MAEEAYAVAIFFGFIDVTLITVYSIWDKKCDDELLTEEEIRQILEKRRK